MNIRKGVIDQYSMTFSNFIGRIFQVNKQSKKVINQFLKRREK